MRSVLLSTLCAAVAAAGSFCLSGFTLAAEPDPATVVVSIERVPRAPVLDDFLDMRAPDDLTPYLTRVDGGFIQREPVDGAPANQHTDVYLGYDDQTIYAVFVAFDDEPGKIRATLGSRENVFGDDIVEIQLDTFHDQRRAYTFICNPFGVQFDAVWTEGGGFDGSWDTVWESKGALTDRGYVVWMAIPFKSLRFPQAAEQQWGFLLGRDVQRNNEETFFPALTNRIEGRLNQAGTLRGLEAVSPGRNMQLIPYVFARGLKVLDEEDPSDAFFVRDSFDPEIGLDAKFVFQDRMVLDLTVNPDFSQVESDDPQITVNQRFEVFFPEKRPFFLENATFFATPRNLLNTRRIVDPAMGARLSGKMGKTNLGVLLIDDEGPGTFLDSTDPDFGKTATIGVLRIDRDVGEQSRVGAFYSARRFSNEENRVASLDTRLRLGEFWTIVGQVATSSDESSDGTVRRDPLFDLSVVREDRNTFAHVHFREVGEDFDAPLGFIPRTGFREFHTREGYIWWHEGARLLKVESSVFFEHIEDPDGLRLDRMLRATVEADFIGQTEASLVGRSGRTRVDGIDYPVQAIEFSLQSRPFNAAGGNLEMEFNRGVNFSPAVGVLDRRVDGVRGEFGVDLRLFHRMRIDNSIIYNRLEDHLSGDKVLSNTIARSRWDWTFDLKSSLRFIAEWRTVFSEPTLTSQARRKLLNFDLLYRWQRNPWTAFYIGANSNRRNIELLDTPPTMSIRPTESLSLTDAWQVFVKMSYLLRF